MTVGETTMLVVEDEENTRKLLKQALEESGS